jgi:hypothetical protein
LEIPVYKFAMAGDEAVNPGRRQMIKDLYSHGMMVTVNR